VLRVEDLKQSKSKYISV